MTDLPDWAKDPDAVLEKRRKDAERPSFADGLYLLLVIVGLGIAAVLEVVAYYGGLKATGWFE